MIRKIYFSVVLILFLLCVETVRSQSIDSLMQQVNNNNYVEAIVGSSEMIAGGLVSADLFFIRGYSYFQLGRFEDALLDLTNTIKINENYVQAYIYRAKTKQQLGSYISAMADYSEARKRDPYKTTAEVVKSFVVSLFSKKGD